MLSRTTQATCARVVTMVIVTALSTVGCSSAGVRGVGGGPVPDVRQAIASGEARLTCGLPCSGAWGAARARAKGYYDQALWQDLEALVAQVGHNDDLAYYYLAAAAEGQGRMAAASTYHRLALAAAIKCDGLFDNCDGLDVPALAAAALERLHAGPAAQATAAAPPSSTPTAAALARRPDCIQPGNGRASAAVLRYPREAKRLGQEGVVLLEFIVEADGSVAPDGLRIERGSGVDSIDEAALAFVRNHRFSPGMCNGIPTRMGHKYVVSMRLGDGS